MGNWFSTNTYNYNNVKIGGSSKTGNNQHSEGKELCESIAKRPGSLQTYDEVEAEIIKEREKNPDYLFCDESFVPHDIDQVTWKRPKEITDNWKFKEDGITTSDIHQGNDGDCWILAAIASVCREARFINRVVPAEQGLSQYGAYHFKFYISGQWTDVLVDDRLPTRGGRLHFGQGQNKNEFWVPLLEKACAKVKGSYEGLWGGWSGIALKCLTGGEVTPYELPDKSPTFDELCKCFTNPGAENESFACCTTPKMDEKNEGVVAWHVYSVINAKNVTLKHGKTVELVQVRNPWGRKKGPNEWKGKWSDGSKEWEDVVDEDMRKEGDKKIDDGEFWMDFEDFKHHFNQVTIVTAIA